MKSVLRLATVDPDERNRNALKTMLLGVDTVWLEAECSRYEFFMDVARQTLPDMALINLDSNPARGLQLVSEITRANINCAVMVVSSSQEGSLILQAMRNGAENTSTCQSSLMILSPLSTGSASPSVVLQVMAQREAVRSSQLLACPAESAGRRSPSTRRRSLQRIHAIHP
jgi:DNA-binding NarL/FixJ family response regulator